MSEEGVATKHKLFDPSAMPDPKSVIEMPACAPEAIKDAGVNAMVAVVVVALIREPRVMMGPISALVISGNVPLMEESRIAAPSLVVPAATAAIAGCATAGRVNCENFMVNSDLSDKFHPGARMRIFKTCALSIVGVHMTESAA